MVGARPRPAMTEPRGRGHFVSWDGGCLLIGSMTAIAPMHSHYAIQIAFGSTHGIRFRQSDDAEWTSYEGVVIPSRQPHMMDSTHVPVQAVLLIEAETREGRALRERFSAAGINALSSEMIGPARDALFASWQHDRTEAAVVRAAQSVVGTLTAGVEPSVVSDERIIRATTYIRAHIDGPLTLAEVAAEAFLSPSRFRHLFVEETGMALRPYILWRRFIRVWELLMAGESLSSAAHAAGFADAAHLTRTCRRMFGFPPSAIQFAAPLRDGTTTKHLSHPRDGLIVR
jgi:AraC family transcriptional regulator